MNWKKGTLSGIVATIVFLAVSFALEPFYPERGVWFAQEFPGLMTEQGLPFFFLAILVLGLVMGLFYGRLQSVVPGQGVKKGIVYGLGFFVAGGILFPIMMLGYAPPLIAVSEIVFSIINYAIAGTAVQLVHERV